MGMYYHNFSESQIEKKFHRLVVDNGGTTRKFVSPNQRGVPDRIVFWPKGVVHFVELKTDKGKLTPMQVYEHKVLQRFGARVFTLYGLAEVEAYVNDYGWSHGQK